MAGSFTDSFENSVLDYIFSGTALPSGTFSVGLFTTAPTDSTAGTEVPSNAVPSNGYTRQSTGTWTASSNGQVSNTTDIVFPAATNSGWGIIVAVGIFKGTTLIAHADITPKEITVGDTVKILAGDLDVTLT